MQTEPVQILDPEFLVPSADAAEDRVFWARMIEWSDSPQWKIGPATLSALYGMTQTPPKTGCLPIGDFWKIIGKFMSRGFPIAPDGRALCERHIRDDYSPNLGDGENVELLIPDLKAIGPVARAALATESACWSDLQRSCEECNQNHVAALYDLDSPETASSGLAAIWRQAYLDEHRGDPTRLAEYSAQLFPNLQFSDVAWSRMGTLAGGAEDVVRGLVVHLGVLSDHAGSIWRGEITREGRQAEFGSKGVEASPESPKTHRNVASMRQRDFQFGSDTTRCEWHTKLRPDVNRIYFAVMDDHVRVGIITNHLPT